MTSLDTERAIFTPEEAVAYLQVSREAILRYIEDGNIEAERLGGTVSILRRSLERLSFMLNTRLDITLRDYTAEQLAAFAEEDVLDGTALEIARRFDATHGIGFFDTHGTNHAGPCLVQASCSLTHPA